MVAKGLGFRTFNLGAARRCRAAAGPGKPLPCLRGLEFRVQGLGFRVEGLGFRVQGFGCRVED